MSRLQEADGSFRALLRQWQPSTWRAEDDLSIYLNDLYAYDLSELPGDGSESESASDLEIPDEWAFQVGGDEDEEAEGESEAPVDVFTVRAFGLTDKGVSVSCDITDFQPYFFIKIPENWKETHLDYMISVLKENVYYKQRDNLVTTEILLRKPFSHFTGDDVFKYAKLVFRTSGAFNSFLTALRKPVRLPRLQRQAFKFDLYESNITPVLRLLHLKNINPSGWIRCPGGRYELIRKANSNSQCQIHVKISYNALISEPEKLDIPPFIYASFDIEAESSHGDFPLAQKTFQKLARDIMTEYQRLMITQPQRLAQEGHALILRWMQLAFDPFYMNSPITALCRARTIVGEADLSRSDQTDLVIPTELIATVMAIGRAYTALRRPSWRLEGHDDEDAPIVVDGSHSADSVNGTRGDPLTASLIDYLYEEFERVLPALDLERSASDYRRLATEMLGEYERVVRLKIRIFQSNPLGCIAKWFELAFDHLVTDHNVNRVFINGDKTPAGDLLEQLTPRVYDLCQECYVVVKQKGVGIDESELSAMTRLIETEDSGGKKPYARDYGGGKGYGGYGGGNSGGDDEDGVDEIQRTQDAYIDRLDQLFLRYLPCTVAGDPVIQIGTVFKRYGEKDPWLKHIITLGSCDRLAREDLIADEHKNISLPLKVLVGEVTRSIKDGLKGTLSAPALKAVLGHIDEAALKGSGMIERVNANTLEGRIGAQLQSDNAPVIIEQYATEREVLCAWTRLIQQADPDHIIGYNIFGFDFKYLYQRAIETSCLGEFDQLGRIKGVHQELKEQKLSSSGLGDNLLHFIPMFGRVLIDVFKVVQSNYKLPMYKLDYVCKEFLNMAKNDLPPKELFVLQKGTAADRAVIARYCLVDCILCQRLTDKLEILTSNIGMSNVCSVPLSYLFQRGQGVRILSLVSKMCHQDGYLIPVLRKPGTGGRGGSGAGGGDGGGGEADEGSYEGAIVLPPQKDIYFDAVGVCDFNSLYPSCMIAENLSHDSWVQPGSRWDNLPGQEYVDIPYDLYEEVVPVGKKKAVKVKCGVKTCRFAQLADGKKSLIPRICMQMLKARKDTRRSQKDEPKGSFKWNVLEGLQLAYKTTANSIYGQCGANTSPICKKDIAACTTATGRGLIYFTRDTFERHYPGANGIYGDTDSVFIKFDCRDSRGVQLHGLDAIFRTMEWCTEGALFISRQLKTPHNLEFEKAIWPFVLLTKKRYHGHYYTDFGQANYSKKSMGIALKRRDNADIVKTILGGTLDIIMKEHDLAKALRVGRGQVERVLQGQFDLRQFIITKTLRSYYKMPDSIAHQVLAQRIGRRDPGNKPRSNDRLAYAYIKLDEESERRIVDSQGKILQGDRIETPEFISEHRLPLDYRFYVTNQIMKPVLQIFALKTDLAGRYMFDEPLQAYDNRSRGLQSITKWFTVTSEQHDPLADLRIVRGVAATGVTGADANVAAKKGRKKTTSTTKKLPVGAVKLLTGGNFEGFGDIGK